MNPTDLSKPFPFYLVPPLASKKIGWVKFGSLIVLLKITPSSGRNFNLSNALIYSPSLVLILILILLIIILFNKYLVQTH